jgi:transglutaminase-like putative cysteine protease
MNSQAGRETQGTDATVAALATLTAAWPISTLLAEPTWVSGTVLLLTVIALSGVGARSFALRGWQVLMVQLVSSVLAASAIYGQGHLWRGLPTFATLGHAGDLVQEALVTVQAYAAPAPTTPGLTFVVGCGLGLTALAVDYLAVTRRSPSLAGLPLLTAFLAAAANSGAALPVMFFVAAATMWLILVARSGRAILRQWGTTAAVARTPIPQNLGSAGGYEYSSMARTLGALALVAAVAVPVALPQVPPTFIGSGLGRSSSAGNGSRVVGFSQSLDLAADLASPSTNPVLEYRTADPSPPPLRVAVGSFYKSDQSVWEPRSVGLPALSTTPPIPEPPGLSSTVPQRPFTMTFSRNLLDEPNLAAPYPLISADLGNIPWGLTAVGQEVKVGERPESYSVSYLRLEPTPKMLREASTSGPRILDPNDPDLDRDGEFALTVDALTERLTAGKKSGYDDAMAIQQYLRTSGGFTYSLTLADASVSAAGAPVDPLTNFLITKQGYCVQFASAMVMMSRSAGIPARMAIGFLPGTPDRDLWTVTAADAHTWPELYFEGIGWTRFEPTPSRGAPAAYAVPPAPSGTAAENDPLTGATAAPGTAAPKDLGDPSIDNGTNADVGLSPISVLEWLTHGWGAVLLASLVGLIGSVVVPAAALWRRRRRLISARTAGQRVEVQWELLTSSLGDLGIAPAPSRTPKQQCDYYGQAASLEGDASHALGRVVQTLERSRYTMAGPPPDGMAADARQVFKAAAANRSRRDRLRAGLWPSSGIAQLRSARADFAWRVLGPLRDTKAVLRQRFPRRPRR